MQIHQSRRKFMHCAGILSARSFFVWNGVGIAVGLTSCGGGSDSGNSSGSGSGNQTPTSPTTTQSTTPTIQSISNSAPTALTSFQIKTTAVDTTKPFTVVLTAQGKTGTVTLTPIRTDPDGTIVLATPLHIDSATGQTANLPATITVSQNGVTSPPVPLTITDLPQISDYGLQLGVASRAFYVHQQLTIAHNLNALQALKRIPTSKTDTTQLQTRLGKQLINCIMARSDVDRMITNNNLIIPIGTSADGVPIQYSAVSLALQDRLALNYLSLYANAGVTGKKLLPSEKATLSQAALPSLLQTISMGTGWYIFKTAQQALADPKSSVLDDTLATASIAQTVVTVGAGLVAVGAAVVGAPAIAAGAAAVLTYGALAGVLIGGVSVTNDIYNLATTGYKYIQSNGTDIEAKTDAEKAISSLGSDLVGETLQVIGIGGVAKSLEGTVANAAESVFEGVFNTTRKDIALGAGQFVDSVANLVVQNSLSTDAKTSDGAIGDATALSQTPSVGIGIIDGKTSITNSQGPVLSALTGVAATDGTQNDTFSSLADESGDYDLLVPVGVPGVNYSDFSILAYDPVAGKVLAAKGQSLTGLNPAGTMSGPALSGVCTDLDASHPDSDDPDCD